MESFIAANPDEEITFYQEEKVFHIDNNQQLKMTDDELSICCHEIPCYSFKDSRWGYFPVDDIRAAAFNSQSFSSLILPASYKKQILSLVSIHGDARLKFDDLIHGKGKGMVFLLHGAPGLGKTLTAGKSSPLYAGNDPQKPHD